MLVIPTRANTQGRCVHLSRYCSDKQMGGPPPFFRHNRPLPQLNKMSTPIYFFDKDTDIHKLEFYYEMSFSARDQDFTTPQGRFTLQIKKGEGVYLFRISTDWEDPKLLSLFKSCSARAYQGVDLAFNSVSLPKNKTTQYGKSPKMY